MSWLEFGSLMCKNIQLMMNLYRVCKEQESKEERVKINKNNNNDLAAPLAGI